MALRVHRTYNWSSDNYTGFSVIGTEKLTIPCRGRFVVTEIIAIWNTIAKIVAEDIVH